MSDLSGFVDRLPLWIGIGGTLGGSVILTARRWRGMRFPVVLFTIGSVVLVFWSWFHLSQLADASQSRDAHEADYAISLQEMWAVKAVTDRGRRIRLAIPGRAVAQQNLLAVENAKIHAHSLERKAIARSEPDPSHNCHGWVFAGGRFWIAGDEVDEILADNQYILVSTPESGDLAIYRGDRGEVVHSGIVRSTAGCTLIESKWGPMSRFIHGIEDQPFGGECEFYHTGRRGHLLNGLGAETDPTESPGNRR